MEKEKWGNDGVVERELLVDEAGAVHVVDDAGGRGAEGIALVVEIDDEVIDVQQHVVGRYLVEHALRELHRRRLVFNYHHGLRSPVVQHAVAPQTLVARAKLHLVGHERRRIALMLGEEVDEMLAHPLFGRQADVAPPQRVEDVRLALSLCYFYFVLW